MPLDDPNIDDGLSLFTPIHDAPAAAVPDEQPAPLSTTTDPPALGARSGDLPPTTPVTEPAAPARSTVVRDALRARGYDYDDSLDDEAVVNELHEAAALARDHHQHRDLIEQGKRYQQHAAQFEQYLAQQFSGQPAPAAQPAAQLQTAADPNDPFGAWSNAPEFNPEWLRLVEKNEHGDLVIAKRFVGVVDPTIPQKIMRAVEWEQERSRMLARDYPKLTEQLVDRKVESMREVWRKEAREVQLEIENEREIDNFVAQHREHLFVTDEQGRTRIDPRTGQPLRQPFGELVNRHSRQLCAEFYGGKPYEQLPALEKRKVVQHAFKNALVDWQAYQARFAQQQQLAPTANPAQLAAPTPGAVPAQLPAQAPGAAPATPGAAAPAEERPRDERGRFVERAIEHARGNATTDGAGDGAARRNQQLDDEDDDLPFSKMREQESNRLRNGHAARV